MKRFKTALFKYRSQDDGAVTVDWVVLTASVVGLGALALQFVWGGTDVLSNNVSDEVESIEVGALGDS
ncbi:hypothetical protein [Celeribacter sp.]|uniref:hypothetical protein n=1 Tax=Celeribacter sp. TaxID=1890673 RepID=UPI003A909B84